MARNKLTIDDIQKALLSNTHFIKEAEPEKPLEITQVNTQSGKVGNPTANDIQIDQRILENVKILSTYLGIDQNELINKALMYYLSLKSAQLEQAVRKHTKE
jgi:hypothetical protein